MLAPPIVNELISFRHDIERHEHVQWEEVTEAFQHRLRNGLQLQSLQSLLKRRLMLHKCGWLTTNA